MNTRILNIIMFLLTSTVSFAQPKTNYYTTSLDGKNGRTLELALQSIVYPHTDISYSDLWDKYPITDPGPTDSIPSSYTGSKTDLVYDMYAWMGQFPKFYSDTDRSQTGGINREHCVPNSWWGGKYGNDKAYSDLHHLVPADGAANSAAKSDYPLGEYASGMTLGWPTEDKYNTDGKLYVSKSNPCSRKWTLTESMKSSYGGAPCLFEPTDEYKGDFARMYFYVVCAYEGALTWQTNYMFTSDASKYTTIKPWALELLLKWHRQDRISDKERNRNNAVESVQGNRNPFIDYPELVEYIWGNKTSENFSLANALSAYSDEYKKGGSGGTKKTASITFVLKGKVGQAFQGFKYNTNSDGEKKYTSSNTSVATVDALTGDVTLLSVGETTITYSTTATSSYTAGEEKYIIQVSE